MNESSWASLRRIDCVLDQGLRQLHFKSCYYSAPIFCDRGAVANRPYSDFCVGIPDVPRKSNPSKAQDCRSLQSISSENNLDLSPGCQPRQSIAQQKSDDRARRTAWQLLTETNRFQLTARVLRGCRALPTSRTSASAKHVARRASAANSFVDDLRETVKGP